MPETIAVKDSILESTKQLVGLRGDDAFDLDVITGINSAFATLYQAGVGPLEGYQIADGTNLWSEFTGDNMHINDVKTYVYLKVKLDFDAPSSSFGLTAVERRIDELIWRLNVAADFTIVTEPTT